MYYYLIDSERYEGKNFEFFQTRLLSLINEYHVPGETARVTSLRRIEDLVATALAHGTKTLVVVGSDDTFSSVIDLCRGKNITLAFVPINPQTELGRILGVEDLDNAVLTIARRRIEYIDIARVNDKYFISCLKFGALEDGFGKSLPASALSASKILSRRPIEMEIVFDGSYTARDSFFAGIIVNTRDTSRCDMVNKNRNIGSPRDGHLDVVLLSKISRFQLWRKRKSLEAYCLEDFDASSVVSVKKVTIKSPEGMHLVMDGRIVAQAPVDVEMVPEKLKMIVGRDRQF